jgi:hypothetical protein
MSASLVRAACAATSANPPATSARFCHRTSASGALFSPLPTACAVGFGRHPPPFFRSRATRSALRPGPFDPSLTAGGWSVARRLLQSLVPIREHNLRIARLPADSISSIDRRFSAGRSPLSSCWGRSLSPISQCSHRAAAIEPGAGRRFRVHQQNRRVFRRFRAFFAAIPLLPQLRCRAHTSRRRARGESRSWSLLP